MNKNDLEGFTLARHMARYGGKDWLSWTDKNGNRKAEVCTPTSLKKCLLDCGTQGRWHIHDRQYAMQGDWWIGCNMLRQMKRRGIT